MGIEVVKGLWLKELICKCGNSNCKDTKNFTSEEMEFLQRISDVRSMMGIKMIITSYRRCPLHDYYRATSGHSLIKNDKLYSVALDVKPIGCTVEELYLFCEKRGFHGLGINVYLKYLHMDQKARVARWWYDEDNIAQTILYKEL